MKCKQCGTEKFSLEEGVDVCDECGTHFEGTREESVEEQLYSNKTLLSSPGSEKSKALTEVYPPWTTTEAYNIIIYEQVSSLINLGASNKLKDVVLYIWSRYLQKCGVAFCQKDPIEKELPRHSLYAKKRDLKVLYGDKYGGRKKKTKGKLTKKKQTKKGSRTKTEETVTELSDTNEAENMENELESGNILEGSSEAECSNMNDGELREEENITDDVEFLAQAQKDKDMHSNRKKIMNSVTKELCVDNMTLSKTLCFCYLGLIYTGDQLLLLDLIRFVHEGRIPYLRAADCLPSSMKLQCDDHSSFNVSTTPDLWKISLMCAKLIDFIDLPKFKHRSLIPIVLRFIKDLNLPDNIIHIVKILIAKTKEHGHWYETKKVSKTHYLPIPLYEVQAMAFIIIVLKMVFVLDGKFELEHSEIMVKINVLLEDRKLFVWEKWRKQASLIEYMFMKSGTAYSNFSLFDSLSTEEIISKYPFICSKESGDFPNKNSYAISTARHRIRNIFMNKIQLKILGKPAPTSFPLKQKIAYFMTKWEYLPMYKETKQMDFAFLSEDFSLHQLFFKPTITDMSSNDLITLLISSLYESVEVLTLSHSASNYQNIVSSTSKYWFKNFSQKQLSGSDSVWLDTLPSSFQWLLQFLCKYSQISCKKMYCEVLRLEKELFLHAKKVKH